MSEETQGQGTAPEVDPKVESEAKSLGWVPKEHFRGDPEKWSDAETFVRRGKEILPILRSNNKRLEDQLAQTRAENARLAQAIKDSSEAIADLKKYQDENTRREVEREVGRLKKELVQAKKDENIEAEVEISDQIRKAEKALDKEPEPPKRSPPPQTEPAVDPLFTAWLAKPENQWFQTDARKQALAVSIAQELRRNNSPLTGEAFFDKVSEEVHEYLGSKVAPMTKVNGSGGGSGNKRESGKSYKDLPSDARAACDKFAETLVGKGKAYPTADEWRSKYAADYFKE